MEKNIIKVYFEPKSMTIIDRAKFLVDKQNEIAKYLNKFDWLLFDKTSIDIRQQEVVVSLFLNRIKKRIKTHTTMKNVPDNFLDIVNTRDGFFASKRFDNDASFSYGIGAVDKEKITSNLVINNYTFLDNLNDFDGLKKFILELVHVFDPYSIESSERAFYRGLMDLDPFEYWFGGLTYISKYVKIPPIPSSIKVEELPNGGKLLITTEQPFSSENSAHVDNAKLLVDLFRKHGIKTLYRGFK